MPLIATTKFGWLDRPLGRFWWVTLWPFLLLLVFYGCARVFGLWAITFSYFNLLCLLVVPYLLVGYTWVARSGLTSKFEQSKWLRLLISIIFAVTGTIVASLIFGLLVLFLFAGPFLATFAAPVHPDNKVIFEVSFLPDEFVSRLFVQPAGHPKMQLVANLSTHGDVTLSSGQWSKDGQLLVCFSVLNGNQPVPAITYDFGTNQRIVPVETPSEPGSDYMYTFSTPSAAIQKLIADHGGLDGEVIDNRAIEHAAKKLFGVLRFDQPRP